MTKHTPLFMQASLGDTPPEYSALLVRQAFAGIWNGDGLLNFTGSDLKVTQRAAGANFSVDVAPGMAVIKGDDVAGQGYYMVWSDAVENLTIPAPPVSGSHTHRVVARVKDKLHNGAWAGYTWEPEVLPDIGGGLPALPNSAIDLATVSVAAGQTSVTTANITHTSAQAVSTAGVAKWADSDAARPVNPTNGQKIWRTDKLCEEIAVGGAWYEIARRDGGGSAWTAYTPTVTGTTTNPTLGSGSTRSGRYIREGRRVTVQAVIKFGTSGVGVGSGFYEVSLPVAARSTSPGRVTGAGYAYDNSVPNFEDGCSLLDTGVTDKVRVSIGGTVVGSSFTWTWAANDEFGFTIVYEAAT